MSSQSIPIMSIQKRRKSDEVEALLELGEQILHRCEHDFALIRRLRTFQLLGLVLTTLGASSVLFAAYKLGLLTGMSKNGGILSIFGLGLFSLTCVFILENRITHLKFQLMPERRSLGKIYRTLLEAEAMMGEQQSWSIVDRTRFHIKLARYDIELFEEDPLKRITGPLFIRGKKHSPPRW